MRPEWTLWVAHSVIPNQKDGEQLIIKFRDWTKGSLCEVMSYVYQCLHFCSITRSLQLFQDPTITNPGMLYLSEWAFPIIVQYNMTHLPLIKDEGFIVAAWQSLKLLAWLVYAVVITRWLCGLWPTFRLRSAKTWGIIDSVQGSARRERVLEWIVICSCLIRLC